ncbi:hypothetical protein GcM3_115026, partial [Golovinomyces cichoracearum]
VTRKSFTILIDPICTAPTKHKTTRAETQNRSLPCSSPTPHQIDDPLTFSFSPSDTPPLTDKLNLSNPDFHSKGVDQIQKLDPLLEKLDKIPEQAEPTSPLKTESPVVHNERTSVINCFQDSSPQKIPRETAVLLSPSQAANTNRNSSLVVFTGSRLSAPTENHADPNSRQSTSESARKSSLFLLKQVPKFKDPKSHYEKVIRLYNLHNSLALIPKWLFLENTWKENINRNKNQLQVIPLAPPRDRLLNSTGHRCTLLQFFSRFGFDNT